MKLLPAYETQQVLLMLRKKEKKNNTKKKLSEDVINRDFYIYIYQR